MGSVMGLDGPVILEVARIQGLDMELVTQWLPLADAAVRDAMRRPEHETDTNG